MSPAIFVIGILVALLLIIPWLANRVRPWWSQSTSPYAAVVRRAKRDLRAKLPGDRVWRGK